MTIAEVNRQQTALKELIYLFEDAVVRTAAASPVSISFDPILVIDMRFSMFQSFILSLRADGILYPIPRMIQIEEAEQISVARERTPLCAYRKKKTQNWKVCSEGRLKEIAESGEFDVAKNALSYAVTLPDKERAITFERLWFTFLSLLIETDSGQDYKRIAFVVDNGDHASLLQSVLPKVGSRLDKGGNKWQSALIIPIDHSVDIRGFAFLNSPPDFLESQAEYLLFLNAKEAIELNYDGSSFQCKQIRSVNIERYDKLAVVGIASSTNDHSNVLHYANQIEFETACLIGYVHWWLQIDEEQLDVLRQKEELLKEQLVHIKAETIILQNLLPRLQNVLRKLDRV